ncbi:MAG: SRPBCC family protein [Pseudomonadota bacterium]
MTPDLDAETDLSFTRTLAVPRQLVWECWTDAKHIPHFFIPTPNKVTAVDIDLRVGGRFNTTFDVDGNVMDNRGVYLEVVPGEKLVFTDAYTEGWKPAPEPFMTAILLLSDAPDGGTTYTAIARHRNRDTCKMHKDMGFFDGWGTVVTQLEAYAKGLMK